MTHDDVIRLAREVADRDKVDPVAGGMVTLTPQELSRFATLVAAATKEHCAQICDAEASIEGIAQRCAAAIRGMP